MFSKGWLARAARIVAWGFAALLFVLAAEYQAFAYVASEARYRLDRLTGEADPAPTPQQVLDSYADSTDTTLTLLVTSDIKRCKRTDMPMGLLPAISNQLGWRGSYEPYRHAPEPMIALARQWPDAPILAVGDLEQGRGMPGEFADCFAPSWGDLRHRTLPAPGNHEYITPGAFAYYDFWGQQAGPDRRGYYAVTWRNWLILSLNSEIDAQPGSDQALWIDAQLQKHPDACVLSFFHRPAHALSHRRFGEDAMALFQQVHAAGASMVLNGHNHIYERSKPITADGKVDEIGGMTRFTVGPGGALLPHHTPESLPDHIDNVLIGKPGLLRLELDDSSIAWTFHLAPDGTAWDEGKVACRTRS
jgi:acid phosphatase type 7